MKIIISPAKKMNADLDFLPPKTLPVFLERAEELTAGIKRLSYRELKKLLACNDQIAELNYARYAAMDLRRGLTPALLAYDGIQYKYMAPAVFSTGQFTYVEEHLRILSGLYGLLRPFDGVTPYRLEMQAKLDLYAFWGDTLARALGEGPVLNLASEEYARAVTPFRADVTTPIFGELIGGKVVEKGVYVKMARGEMVRWMSERNVERIEDIRDFDGLGYQYCPERSEEKRCIFLQKS